MKIKLRPFLYLLLGLILLGFTSRGQQLGPGTGYIVFNSYSPFASKPIRVYYHIPNGNIGTMPVLMAIPGEERDGRAYVSDWITASDQYKFMVFGPELPDSLFPGGNNLNEANMFTDGDNPTRTTLNPDSIWTFSLFDPLFLSIKQRTGTNAANYMVYAHSAGAQLVERFLLYKPNSLMQFGICANAGWYNMPNNRQNFPYGTKLTPITHPVLLDAFAKKMLFMFGKNDTGQTSFNLRHNPVVDVQGLNRLTRGRYFISKSRDSATLYNTPFNWNSTEVPSVGHDHTLMARAAVPYVVSAINGIAGSELPELKAFWTGGNIKIKGLLLNETFQLAVYSLEGKVMVPNATYQPSDTSIPFTPASGGVYLVVLQGINRGSKSHKLLVIY